MRQYVRRSGPACATSHPRRALFMIVLLAGLVGVAQAQDGRPEREFLEAELEIFEPVPVIVWNRRIIDLRAAFRGSTAEERAERYTTLLGEVPYDDLDEPIATVNAAVGELRGVQILLGDSLILTLVQQDLPRDGRTTLDEYAAEAVVNLKSVFAARAEQRRPEVLWRAVLVTTTASVVFVAFLVTVLKTRTRLTTVAGRYLHRIEMRIFDVDLRPFLGAFGSAFSNLMVFGLLVVAIYLWLSAVLAAIPYSQPVAAKLGRWLLDAAYEIGDGILESLPGLVTVVLIVLLTRLVTRAVGSFFTGVETGVIQVRWLARDTSLTTRRIVSGLIWVFSLTVAYPYIPGSSTDAFKGVSVLLGLMLSLGSAGLINQIMSGLVIVYSRALRAGDIVRVGETDGIVTQVGLLSTRLVTAKEESVTIPNAVVVANQVVNFASSDRETDAQISTGVTIGYDAPWRQVHALLLAAAAQTPGIRRAPDPFVVQRALSDFYVEYELRAKVESGFARFRVLSDLHAAVQDVFNDAGVQIMSPHFESQPDHKVYAPRESAGRLHHSENT